MPGHREPDQRSGLTLGCVTMAATGYSLPIEVLPYGGHAARQFQILSALDVPTIEVTFEQFRFLCPKKPATVFGQLTTILHTFWELFRAIRTADMPPSSFPKLQDCTNAASQLLSGHARILEK